MFLLLLLLVVVVNSSSSIISSSSIGNRSAAQHVPILRKDPHKCGPTSYMMQLFCGLVCAQLNLSAQSVRKVLLLKKERNATNL